MGFSQFQIALIFGALASATAPAGTAAVFWENDARGALTTTTMFILALDDIVAIILTDIAIDYSTLIYEKKLVSLAGIFLPVIYDVGFSLILGGLAGYISIYFLKHVSSASLLTRSGHWPYIIFDMH